MPALLALMLLAAPVPETDARLEELTRAYQQACETRIFGQFDDMCGSLHDQIARYRADLRRKPAPKPAPAPDPHQVVGASTTAAPAPAQIDPPR